MGRRLFHRTGPLAALAVLLAFDRPAEADPFAGCAAQFAARPDEYASSYCFFQAAQQEKRWEEAARRLDALRDRHPRNFWLTLARGNVEWTRDPARAEALYRQAAQGFAETGLAEGEVLARTNLRTLLYRKGRLEEAGREVELAVRVAEASGQDLVLARALALQAAHLTDTGRDLLTSYRTLRRAELAAFPGGPYTLRRSILFALGNASFQLGRLDEALDYYRRVEAMTEETRDGLTRAAAQYNVVNTRFAQLEELPRPGGRDEVLALARSALLTAGAADNRESQAMLHRTLGELLSARAEDSRESREHYEQCIAIARSIRQPRELAHCLWSLASVLAEDGQPQKARARIDEALALVRETGHVWSLSLASRERMRVVWSTRPREEAIAESHEALDTIEAVRRLQAEEGASAEVFSAWAGDYHWLSGRLLAGAQRSRADLERAFAVVERMRARVLLDVLGAARPTSELTPDHPLVARRRELLQRIVDTHRDLLEPATAADRRKALLARLEALELEEQEVRRALRAAEPHVVAYEAPEFASLADVEGRLGPNEALLSFQVGLDRDLLGQAAGGAWLTVSSSTGTVVHPIPDRVRLHAVVPVFLGLFAGRDGREVVPSVKLYRELLAPALAALPRDVDRLVIVPDDLLYRVPFAALRPTPDGEPVGARFEVTIAPSATLWLRGREGARDSLARAALVMADPTVSPMPAGLSTAAAASPGPIPATSTPGGRSSVSTSGAPSSAPTLGAPSSVATREWSLSSQGLLGRLPHARQEGRAVARRLGGSTLWVGNAASEHALKQAHLADFSLLHFAAHAVADVDRPERSAVLLAAGSRAEDGLLQSREIVELPLAGRVVVLSACRSAGGSVLRGEGVLSLARAFFQAGSPAIVASLWPLRDDEAARVFDAFYRHLARGSSLGAALRSAQREAMAAGEPTDAWAGLQVFGDGSFVPFPGGARASWPFAPFLLALAGVLAAALAWRAHRWRQVTSRTR